MLSLTVDGRRLVDAVTEHRRATIATVLAAMPERRRSSLTAALDSFAVAAGEHLADDSRLLAW